MQAGIAKARVLAADIGVTRCIENGSQLECTGPGISFVVYLTRSPCQVSVDAPPSIEWAERHLAERLGFEPHKPTEEGTIP